MCAKSEAKTQSSAPAISCSLEAFAASKNRCARERTAGSDAVDSGDGGRSSAALATNVATVASPTINTAIQAVVRRMVPQCAKECSQPGELGLGYLRHRVTRRHLDQAGRRAHASDERILGRWVPAWSR